MSFTAPLINVCESAGVLFVNDYEIEEEDFLLRASGNIRVILSDGENTQVEFAPQDVNVDDEGIFTATSITEEPVICSARVSKPICESDLIKENPSTDLAANTALSNITLDVDSKDFTFTQIVFAGDMALYGIGNRLSNEAFQIDVLDEAKKNGSITLEIGSTEATVDDYVSMTTTVATLPGTNLLVPRFHIEGTITGVELDIFQSNSGFVMRLPEEQELLKVATVDGEVLYSVGKKSK